MLHHCALYVCLSVCMLKILLLHAVMSPALLMMLARYRLNWMPCHVSNSNLCHLVDVLHMYSVILWPKSCQVSVIGLYVWLYYLSLFQQCVHFVVIIRIVFNLFNCYWTDLLYYFCHYFSNILLSMESCVAVLFTLSSSISSSMR